MATERKKGGKGVARSELVAVRFDPRTKYLLELAARTQRRSMANFIEWAVEEAFKQVKLDDTQTLESVAHLLWFVRPGDRLARLQQLFPSLLTYDEQILIDVINRVLQISNLATKSARDSGQQSDFIELHWDFINKSIELGLSPDEIMFAFKSDPPTPAFLDKEISRFQGYIDNLQKLKSELKDSNG
ncbi:hypothetical protein [Achromobacter xylosoxidans]